MERLDPRGLRVLAGASGFLCVNWLRGSSLWASSLWVKFPRRHVRGDGLETSWPGRHAWLPAGAIHEWFGVADSPAWAPPLLLLAHLARRSLISRPSQRILWIGRRVHPSPAALIGSGDDPRLLLERSLFIDADEPNSRVWAIDLALRCPAVATVIADGSGMSMSHSRRLQLAAQSNGRWGIGLLARPPSELAGHSAPTCASMRIVKRSPRGCATLNR